MSGAGLVSPPLPWPASNPDRTSPGPSEGQAPSQPTAPAATTAPKQRKQGRKKAAPGQSAAPHPTMLTPSEQDPSPPAARPPKKSAKNSRAQKSKAGADLPEPAIDNDDDEDDDDSQSSFDGENGEKNADGAYDMDGSVFGRQWGGVPEHAALQSAMRNIHGQITRTMQELRVSPREPQTEG